MGKKLYFTVRFGVDTSWVADGFNMTSEQAKEMLAHRLSGAYNHEISAVVIKRFPQLEVSKLQGYRSLSAMKKADKERSR